jgi:hypothetical protein
VRGGAERVFVLLYFVRHSGKYIVRISTDQTDCPDDYDENYGKHHRVFRNVLAIIIGPQGAGDWDV